MGLTNVLVFVGPGMDSLGPGMDSLGPGMDSLGPGMDSLGPGMDSFGPGMDSFLHCLWFGRHHGALVWGDGPNGGEAWHLWRMAKRPNYQWDHRRSSILDMFFLVLVSCCFFFRISPRKVSSCDGWNLEPSRIPMSENSPFHIPWYSVATKIRFLNFNLAIQNHPCAKNRLILDVAPSQ